MDYHRVAELHHAARATAYASANHHAKATRHRQRAAIHARHSRLSFGGLAKGSEVANADLLGRNLSCPITFELFVDPVVISSGITVERRAIERRLLTSDKCPLTRATITRQLVTNWLVRSIVDDFKLAYGSREGEEWADIRALCNPKPESRPSYVPSAPAVAVEDTDQVLQVKRYVQMPYEELERLSEGNDDVAHREIVRRYILYRATMRDLSYAYDGSTKLPGGVVNETADEVARNRAGFGIPTEDLLGFIRTREAAQLERFGAMHLSAFARHVAASTETDVPFKLLFGLPVTTEYDEECQYGDGSEEDFWYGA
jgi:hypothetical protein